MVAPHLLFQPCSSTAQLRPLFIFLYISYHGSMPLINESFNSCQLHRQQKRIFEPLSRESVSNRIGTGGDYETHPIISLHEIFQPSVDALTPRYGHFIYPINKYNGMPVL